MIRDLREHERVMKAKFAEIYEAQQKLHATQLENFELVLTQLQSCIERGENALERNVSAEILQTNQIIVGRCKELLNVSKPDIYKPPHVHYIIENQLNPSFDRIVVSNTDPFLSLAEVDNQELVREKTVANFMVLKWKELKWYNIVVRVSVVIFGFICGVLGIVFTAKELARAVRGI